MEGKKQAFLEHLPSAGLHAGCFDTTAHPDLPTGLQGRGYLPSTAKTEAQRG